MNISYRVAIIGLRQCLSSYVVLKFHLSYSMLCRITLTMKYYNIVREYYVVFYSECMQTTQHYTMLRHYGMLRPNTDILHQSTSHVSDATIRNQELLMQLEALRLAPLHLPSPPRLSLARRPPPPFSASRALPPPLQLDRSASPLSSSAGLGDLITFISFYLT